MFEMKDGYKFELKTLETMKLFSSANKLIDKEKNGWNVPSLEVAEVVSVQYNIVDNQYKQNSEVLLTFTASKSCAYPLHVEPSNILE